MRRRAQHPRHHRLERERDVSSSSSMADEADHNNSDGRQRSISFSSSHSNNENARPRRRRRKRKSSTERSKSAQVRQKVFSIERALLHLEDEISESQSDSAKESPSRQIGRNQLKDFAVSEGGLVTDDIRKKVWPRLLNIDIIETSVSLDEEQIKANKNYNQVLMDVNRSLKRFPPGISDQDRPELQDQLTRLIIRVLDRNPELHYYQGYHDVAITFLLVLGEEMSYHMLIILSNGPWLREFMHPTMEKTTYLLNYMYPIIKAVNLELYEFLEESEVGTIFALPWLITWFGHVLPDYNDVVRLYDFFLAQPPMMAVYLAAAIVLHRSVDVLRVDCDMASVHGLLSRIPLESPPFEYLLQRASELYEQYPPEEIEPEVAARMKRIQEAALAPRKVPTAGNHVIRKPSQSRTFLKRLVFVTAPVLLGVFLYRFVQNQYV